MGNIGRCNNHTHTRPASIRLLGEMLCLPFIIFIFVKTNDSFVSLSSSKPPPKTTSTIFSAH